MYFTRCFSLLLLNCVVWCAVALTLQFQCFFPQEFIRNIKTPIFLVHPAYDFWQVTPFLRMTCSIFHFSLFEFSLLHFPYPVGHMNFQIKNIFVPDSSDPRGNWFNCKLNIHNCSPSQIEVLSGITLYEFWALFLSRLAYFAAIPDWKYHTQVIVIHCWSYWVISCKTRMLECL